MNLSWRRATDLDLELLAEWNHQLIRDEGHRNPMTVAELTDRMSGWLQGKYEAVIFTSDGPEGYALFKRSKEQVQLRQFFIRRDRRRAGIGRAAFSILKDEIWPSGTRLTVDVLSGNRAGIAFYRSVGYHDYCLTMEILPSGPGTIKSMNQLPPLLRDQRKIDLDHLRLIAVFHFVFAGLSIVGIGFLGLHYAFMHAIIDNPSMWKNQKGPGPRPEEIFAIFKCFYLIFGVIFISGGIANLLSGLSIRWRKYRTFSLVVAGLDCIQIPFGTVLGVFTFIVLLRDSVREVYDAHRTVNSPPTE